ncbi:MAG: cytochrome c biogenesis protein ResB [Bacteroidetes bacterium]|nr:cytochrome c biogenesis protein ResB [Bacteroidota bacterium]
MLLGALTLLSILGTVLPQQDRIGPFAYSQWAAGNPGPAWLARALSLGSLYSEWWFLAIFALLYVNTLACTLPQLRAAYRRASTNLRLDLPEDQPPYCDVAFCESSAEALDSAARMLGRKGYLVVPRAGGIAARKGSLAPWGSPVFHLGLIVLLSGMAISGLFHFTGYIEIGEGQTFVDEPSGYLQRSQGPLFGLVLPFDQIRLPGLGHQGFAVQLDRFTAINSNWREGIPRDLTSEVTISQSRVTVWRAAISINRPADRDGLELYQTSMFGLAPLFRLTFPDGSQQNGMVYLTSRGDGTYENSLHLPGSSYRMTLRARDGDRGVDAEVFERKLRVASGRLEPGGSLRVDDATLTFMDLRRWTGLQVVNQPGDAILYTGFALVAIGLFAIFLLVHKQVWVTVVEGPGGPVLRIWCRGSRLQALFAAEMDEIAEDLRLTLGRIAK